MKPGAGQSERARGETRTDDEENARRRNGTDVGVRGRADDAGRGERAAPSGVAVRGHPRWDARRLFGRSRGDFRDLNGGFNGARCALHHVWTVSTFNTTTNVTTMEWKSAARRLEEKQREAPSPSWGRTRRGT